MSSSEETSPSTESVLLGDDVTSPSVGDVSSVSSKRMEGKLCGVCGDRALGYNFNAITCESCKAFFRRNALKNKEYRCPFNDECEVTAVTRRFCQRCRLRKCFEIGMRKDWIMTEDEKRKKRSKIEENRARRNRSGSEDDFHLSSTFPSTSTFQEDFLGEDEQDSGSWSSRDVTHNDSCLAHLPPKTNFSAPLKPKAVVVGRVRADENENKVLKTSFEQADVHSSIAKSLVPMEDISTSKPRESIFTSISSFAIPCQSSFDSPSEGSNLMLTTQSGQTNDSSSVASDHVQLTTLESFQCPERSSLMMGLLRTQSRESAELPLNSFNDGQKPSMSRCSVEGNSSSSVLTKNSAVVVKSEKDEAENSATEGSCDRSFDFPTDERSSIHRTEDSFLRRQHTWNSMGCDRSPGVSMEEFDFNLGEALSMIQPVASNGDKEGTPVSSPSCNTVVDSIVNIAVKAEYLACDLVSITNSSELNGAEKIKISELLEASKGLSSPLCEEPTYKDLPNPSLINVINLTEIAIRRLIKMAKKISAFKMFCQEDQIALLKGGCTEMMILRSVSAYDPDKDVWKIQQDHRRFKDIKLKVLEAAPGNVYEEHKKFILSFEPDWRHDNNIIALLAAVALFSPHRANVVHPVAIRHEQSSYLYLLKRYLECRYGGCLGKTHYHKLLKIIGNLHVLNEEHVRVFLEVNPREVEPLLIEIFDLKQS